MILVSNLSFSYDGKTVVIDNFSAHLKKGERVCICAPSGGGKTTLMRLLAGLEKPDSGFIEKDGNLKIGMVFQNDVLIPWLTALENASVASDKDEAEKWLTQFGLQESLDKYPDEMSGGMCRRTAIARAVSFEPDVLLLDEPFKGLDCELRADIMAKLSKHFENRLIVFTSHDEAEIEAFATRKIILNTN